MIIWLYNIAVDKKPINELLKTFKNAKRRFALEEVGSNVIVDDYMDTSVPYSKFTKEGYRMTSWNTEPDGSGNCTNTTGTSTQIGTSAFNSSNAFKSSSIIILSINHL